MPRHNPETLVKIVDLMEAQNHAVRDRMDQDFDLFRLKPYEGDEELDGYKKFTSNDPRTAMNLAMHLVTTSQVRFVVYEPNAWKDQRAKNNMKELFVIGCFKAADERRARLMMPSVKESMAAYCLLRGRRAHRAILVKEEIPPDEIQAQEFGMIQQWGLEAFLEEPPPTTRTFVDITDWDIRNVYWGMGPHGVAWACHKVKKTKSELTEEYGLSEDELPDTREPNSEGDSRYLSDYEPEWAIYDYFDEDTNFVVLENGDLLKEPTPHGMGRVPVSIGIVGYLPFLQSDTDDYSSQYGESLYNADRLMFEQNNFMLSIMAELTKRSISQPLLVRSRDGSLTLEGDPRESGAEVSLSTQNEEDIVPLPPMEMVRETGVFLANVQTMMQRGMFPYTAFGELAFQLSGFAINSLRQGMEVPIMPTVSSMMVGLKEIGDILCDAYETGEFDTMTLSGKLQNPTRTYFSEEITPDMLKDAGELEVIIEPTLPQDDATKVQLAALATSGQIPLVDMRFARENYLGLQDVDAVGRAVIEQLADTASPLAMSMKMMNASAEEGDFEKAEIYLIEFQNQLLLKKFEVLSAEMQLMQGQAMQGQMQGQPGVQGTLPGFGPGNSGTPAGPENLSAGVQPSQMGGTPQQNTTPQSGPGAPRVPSGPSPAGVNGNGAGAGAPLIQ